jgi:predicted nucleotidyltransferase
MAVPATAEVIAKRLETLGSALETGCPAIVFAYVFGSAARSQLGPRSDVDLAIYVDDGDAQSVRLEASRMAAMHLGTDAIDFVLLNTAPLSLAGRILGTRRVIVDRKPFERHLYESRTARMFHDFRIREHRILNARFGRG